jgi:hypothetical protein
MSPTSATAFVTGKKRSAPRSISRSGSDPGCRNTVPITRYGGSSRITS